MRSEGVGGHPLGRVLRMDWLHTYVPEEKR
jgi:hypothetical protein